MQVLFLYDEIYRHVLNFFHTGCTSDYALLKYTPNCGVDVD